MANYEEALVTFRDLCDGIEITTRDEYVRGGVNLIADLFGVIGQPVDERMDDVLRDLCAIPFGADPSNIAMYGVKYDRNPRSLDTRRA